MSQHRPEYLRIVPERLAKRNSKRPLVERLAALPETIINHNIYLLSGIVISSGIAAAGFAGLLK